MAIELTSAAVEQSTFVIVASWFDEDGTSVVPNAATVVWTLTNAAGTRVINSRNRVAETSAASVNIVLTGDDLAITSEESRTAAPADVNGIKIRRLVTVEAEYDSNLGTDLKLKESFYFDIIGLRRIV